MRNLFLSIFLVIITKNVYSNSKNFENAYIISNNGDSITGLIEYNNELKLSFGINYKKSPNSDSVMVFKPEYIRKFVFIDRKMEYNSVLYSVSKDNKKIRTKRFAKTIFKKDIILYKLDVPYDETNYSYEHSESFAYVLQIDTNYYTLAQKEILMERKKYKPPYEDLRNYSILRKDYLGVFKYILRDCNYNINRLERLNFNDKDMIRLISDYSDCLTNKK